MRKSRRSLCGGRHGMEELGVAAGTYAFPLSWYSTLQPSGRPSEGQLKSRLPSDRAVDACSSKRHLRWPNSECMTKTAPIERFLKWF